MYRIWSEYNILFRSTLLCTSCYLFDHVFFPRDVCSSRCILTYQKCNNLYTEIGNSSLVMRKFSDLRPSRLHIFALKDFGVVVFFNIGLLLITSQTNKKSKQICHLQNVFFVFHTNIFSTAGYYKRQELRKSFFLNIIIYHSNSLNQLL